MYSCVSPFSCITLILVSYICVNSCQPICIVIDINFKIIYWHCTFGFLLQANIVLKLVNLYYIYVNENVNSAFVYTKHLDQKNSWLKTQIVWFDPIQLLNLILPFIYEKIDRYLNQKTYFVCGTNASQTHTMVLLLKQFLLPVLHISLFYTLSAPVLGFNIWLRKWLRILSRHQSFLQVFKFLNFYCVHWDDLKGDFFSKILISQGKIVVLHCPFETKSSSSLQQRTLDVFNLADSWNSKINYPSPRKLVF